MVDEVEGLVEVLDSKLLKVGATEVDILAIVLDEDGEGRDDFEDPAPEVSWMMLATILGSRPRA